SLLYKEMERKTLYVILPRPIRRWHFLVGKYLGIVCTAGVFIAIVGGVQLWVIALQLEAGLGALLAFPLLGLGALGLTLWRAHDRSLALIPWALAWLAGAAALLASTQASIAPLLAGFALSFSEVLVLAAVALFFSSFSTPFTTALLSLGVWLVGRSAHEMVTMRSALIPEGGRAVLAALAEIFPNFNLFVPSFGALGGLDGGVEAPLGYVITAFGYALAYGCGLLILASMIFRRRDLP
ncbi:MAG: hypothetical protein OEY14_18705, partial [Myxococcales bacterium]|nr:hypothetical protein [Myxococcales bacterium]